MGGWVTDTDLQGQENRARRHGDQGDTGDNRETKVRLGGVGHRLAIMTGEELSAQLQKKRWCHTKHTFSAPARASFFAGQIGGTISTTIEDERVHHNRLKRATLSTDKHRTAP